MHEKTSLPFLSSTCCMHCFYPVWLSREGGNNSSQPTNVFLSHHHLSFSPFFFRPKITLCFFFLSSPSSLWGTFEPFSPHARSYMAAVIQKKAFSWERKDLNRHRSINLQFRAKNFASRCLGKSISFFLMSWLCGTKRQYSTLRIGKFECRTIVL